MNLDSLIRDAIDASPGRNAKSLAAELGVSRQAVCGWAQWRKSRTFPDFNHIEKIADYAQVPLVCAYLAVMAARCPSAQVSRELLKLLISIEPNPIK